MLMNVDVFGVHPHSLLRIILSLMLLNVEVFGGHAHSRAGLDQLTHFCYAGVQERISQLPVWNVQGLKTIVF